MKLKFIWCRQFASRLRKFKNRIKLKEVEAKFYGQKKTFSLILFPIKNLRNKNIRSLIKRNKILIDSRTMGRKISKKRGKRKEKKKQEEVYKNYFYLFLIASSYFLEFLIGICEN